MADKKISALTSLTQGDVAASTDVLPIVDTSATETKKITASALVGAGMTAGVTNVDINSGAIDGTTIGANSAAAGTFTNLTASGTVSFSGAAVSNGGTVATIDINGGTIDATSIGASSASTGAFTTLTTSSTVTLSGGTANGVLYLNGSKVVTSGSGMVFDGTRFFVGTTTTSTSSTQSGEIYSTGVVGFMLTNTTAANFPISIKNEGSSGTRNLIRFYEGPAGGTARASVSLDGSNYLTFDTNNFIINTGNLGIGTASPASKLDTAGTIRATSQTVPSSGTGAELFYDATNAGLRGYNRTGSAYVNLVLNDNVYIGGGSSGNVGIGTTSPGYRLSVAGASGSAVLNLLETGVRSWGIRAGGTATNTFDIADFTAGATRLTIDSSGGVGLGTASPGTIGVSGYTRLVLGAGGSATDGLTIVPSGTGGVQFTDAANVKKGYLQWDSSTGALALGTAGTTKATLDASGNLFCGGTTGSSRLNLQTTTNSSTDSNYITMYNAGENVGHINWINGNGNLARITGTKTGAGASANDGILTFSTALDTVLGERGRFTAGGYFKASNTGTYANATNDRYEFSSDKDDINIIVRTTSTGASVVNLYSQFPAGPNAGAYHFAGAIAGSGYQFTVDADGDVKNTNGSYAAISDLKLKQDIEDAASQWDDIKSVRVRKYRFKRTPDAPLQIGVIAQELEQTSPGLVSEDADRDDENNDLGTTTKSVKYSILYMKAIKALQEAMTRIEQLEAKVAALESK